MAKHEAHTISECPGPDKCSQVPFDVKMHEYGMSYLWSAAYEGKHRSLVETYKDISFYGRAWNKKQVIMRHDGIWFRAVNPGPWVSVL